jgi:hypothetical protein
LEREKFGKLESLKVKMKLQVLKSTAYCILPTDNRPLKNIVRIDTKSQIVHQKSEI